MRKPHRHARHDLQRLLHAPPAHHLGRQRLRLVEQVHQPRLELVGQEIPDGTDVEDRRRALVEAGADEIEQIVSLAHSGHRTP